MAPSTPSTTTTESHLTLPIATVDPTFGTVIRDVFNGTVPSEQFWISCYKTGQPSVHSKIHAVLDEKDRDLVIYKSKGGNIAFVDVNKNYTVACSPLEIPPTHILSPVQEYLDHERSAAQNPQRITAFDIAPDRSKFATGFLDGSVIVYPTSPLTPSPPGFPIPQSITAKETRTTSCPHLSTVTHLQFFPSSRVLLSAGADFSLSILPAEAVPPGGKRVLPARTLRGHTRSVTSTGVIGAGRNVLSSSIDSTVKLWHVGSGAIISSISTHSPVLCMSLGERALAVPATNPDGEEEQAVHTSHPSEVPETLSKIAFCGLEDGTFESLDLGSKSSAYLSPRLPNSSPITAIAYSHENNLLATGSTKGLVTLYDTRALGAPVTSFKRNESGIEDIRFVIEENEVGLAIATADGLPYVAGVVPEGPGVQTELVGADCDSVTSIRVIEEEIWTASHDAVVRRYLHVRV